MKTNSEKTDLFSEMATYAYKNCQPFFTTIELLHNCNYRCLHCYNFDRRNSKSPYVEKDILTTDEVKKLIDQVKELNGFFMSFTGGEPILRDDLNELIAYSKSRGFVTRLKTNGHLLTDELAKSYYESGLSTMDISLYASNNEVYESFTGVKGAFDKVINGIKAAEKNSIKVHLNLIMHHQNVHLIDDMVQVANELNLTFSVSTEITDRYDNSNSDSIALTSEDFTRLLNSKYPEHFEHENYDDARQCSCARSVLGITAVGDIYPCIGAPLKVGNVREDDLIDVWKNSEKFNWIRNLKSQDFKTCLTCEFSDKCSRSSGSIYTNTKDYTGCDEQTLMMAKARKANTP